MEVTVNNKPNGWSDFKVNNPYDHVKSYCASKGYNLTNGLDLGCRGETIKNIILDNFPVQKVYGFEPTPESFEEVKKRYAGDSRIEVFQKAVSNVDGVASFYTNPNKASGNSLRQSKEKQVLQVETIRLDTWAKMSGVTTFDLVKVDVEGHEIEALSGMGELLNTVNVLIAEVRFNDRPTLYHKLATFLEDYNLQLFTMVGVYFNSERISWGDVVFTR